jgi:hypothetical protein
LGFIHGRTEHEEVTTFNIIADTCGLISGGLGLAGYWPDIISTREGSVKPPRLAWLIWSVQYTALLLFQILRGGLGFWLCLPALQLLGTLIIAWLSIRHGNGEVKPLRDTLTFGVVCAALALWSVTHSAALALFIVMAIEGVSMLFIMRHAYERPYEETMWIWRGCTIGGAFGIIAALPAKSAILVTYPVFFTIMGATVIVAHQFGARRPPTYVYARVDRSNR